MPKLAVDGGRVKIHYELAGTGKAKVIFIIGFSTTYSSWESQLEYFGREHGAEYSVCVFDNRGIGKSDAVVGAYSTSRMAADALELLDHLQWPIYNIVGVSMGGMISQELALLAPHRVQSLTLCVTHAGGLTAIPPLFGILTSTAVVPVQKLSKRQEASLYLTLQFSGKFLDAPADPSGDPAVTNRSKLIDQFLEKRTKDGSVSLAGQAGQLAAIGRHFVSLQRLEALRRTLEDFHSPVLIITGTEDHLVRPVNSFILKAALKGRLVVFEGSGHHIHQELASLFNHTLHDHLTVAGKTSKVDGVPRIQSNL